MLLGCATTTTRVVLLLLLNLLDMHTVISSHHEGVGNKVVLHSRVDLDNVSSLSTDVEVEDPTTVGFGGLRPDGQRVGAVLEGPAKLGSVDGKLQVELV